MTWTVSGFVPSSVATRPPTISRSSCCPGPRARPPGPPPGAFCDSTVHGRVWKLMRHIAPQGKPGLPPAPPPTPLPPRVTVPRAEAGTRTFEGSFGVLDLTEVTQAIALGGKTGRLSLRLAAGGGALLFDSRRGVPAGVGPRPRGG